MAQLVSLIRSHSALEEVKLSIKQQMVVDSCLQQRQHSPGLDLLHDQIERLEQPENGAVNADPPHYRHRRAVLDITRIVDSPPYRVPASPWTTVTSDDMLVSNLVSVGLTWFASCYNWIDEVPFVHDMQQGDWNSSYCSSFLVNALLAAACPFSDYDEARTKRGRISRLMTDFIEEAKRILEEEDDQPSLTKTQGLGFLYFAFVAMGQDRVGWEYLRRAAIMAKDLELEYPDANRSNNTAEEQTLSNVLDRTCWGFFNVITLASTMYGKLTEILPPRRPIPPPREDHCIWTPYPHPGPSIPAYSSEQLRQVSMLALIVRDVVEHLSGGESHVERSDFETTTEKIHANLLEWHRYLPSYLLPAAGAPVADSPAADSPLADSPIADPPAAHAPVSVFFLQHVCLTLVKGCLC